MTIQGTTSGTRHEKRVRQATMKLTAATRARDDAFAAASEAGASLRDLGRWSGLSPETVRAILRRRAVR